MMKQLLISIFVAAMCMMATSCGSDGETNAPANEVGATHELLTAEDSLGYYLGVSLAEWVRDGLDSVPESHRAGFDSELFGRGVKTVMAVSVADHPGFAGGARQGANMQAGLGAIRSAGLPVNVEFVVRGFNAGMLKEPAGCNPQELLSQLMRPVNKHILEVKRKEYFESHPGPPKAADE